VMPLAATGIDTSTFWLIVSALGATVSTLASLLYKTERDARIKAEKSLEQFQLIAPDLAENVRWLVEEAQDQRTDALPWPVRRDPPRRTNQTHPRRR
jgi:hypothetical protein